MSKKDELIKKYTGKVTEMKVKAFYDSDKTPTKKYADKMISLYFERTKKGTKRYSDIIEKISKFDELLPYITEKDIYNTNSYPDEDSISRAILWAEQTKEEKSFVKEGNVEFLFENEEFILIRPLTYKASVKYGFKTKWCISSKTRDDQFKWYNKIYFIFFLIRKTERNNEWDKVCFIFPKQDDPFTCGYQVYSSEDTRRTSKEVISKADWDMSTLMAITPLCRGYLLENQRVKTNLDIVKSFIKRVDKLNVQSVIHSISELKNGPKEEVVELLENFTNLMKGINEKLKKVEIDGKLITEIKN
jgi:hypothetical protein